jgi:hypothetical protein
MDQVAGAANQRLPAAALAVELLAACLDDVILARLTRRKDCRPGRAVRCSSAAAVYARARWWNDPGHARPAVNQSFADKTGGRGD